MCLERFRLNFSSLGFFPLEIVCLSLACAERMFENSPPPLPIKHQAVF